jgi:[ribosomal protein S5]-alanine N-acetyltransferase
VDEQFTTERLVMRRFRLADTPAMHRIMTDPLAMRFWSTLPHRSLEQTQEWVRSEIDAPQIRAMISWSRWMAC